MSCDDKKVVVRPNVTDVVVTDKRPTTTVKPNQTKVVRVNRTTQQVRTPATQRLVRTLEKTSTVSIGTPGPMGPEGPQGPSGGVDLEKVAAIVLGGHRVVRSVGADLVSYADNTVVTHGDDVLGVTRAATEQGQLALVATNTEIVEPSWSWTPQEPVYLARDGLMTQNPPEPVDGATFSLEVGFALAPDTLLVRIGPTIYF